MIQIPYIPRLSRERNGDYNADYNADYNGDYNGDYNLRIL